MENNKELETAFQRCIENYFPLNRFDYDLRGVLWFYENELSPNMRKYFNYRFLEGLSNNEIIEQGEMTAAACSSANSSIERRLRWRKHTLQAIFAGAIDEKMEHSIWKARSEYETERKELGCVRKHMSEATVELAKIADKLSEIHRNALDEINERTAEFQKRFDVNLETDIKYLGLSPRADSALRYLDVNKVKDLKKITTKQILSAEGSGKKTTAEILSVKVEYGLMTYRDFFYEVIEIMKGA